MEAVVGWNISPNFIKNQTKMLSRRPEWRSSLTHYDVSDISAIMDGEKFRSKINDMAKTKHKFNFYFYHIDQPNYDPYLSVGTVNGRRFQKLFRGETKTIRDISKQNPDAITIVFTNNLSDEDKVNFRSPWIMFHRMSHAFCDKNIYNYMDRFIFFTRYVAVKYFGYDKMWNDIFFVDHFDDIEREQDWSFMKLFGSFLCTTRAARNNKLDRPYEWVHEVFSQYMMTGKIKFNTIPDLIYHCEEFQDKMIVSEEQKEKLDRFITTVLPKYLERHIDKFLESSKGKIFIA